MVTEEKSDTVINFIVQAFDSIKSFDDDQEGQGVLRVHIPYEVDLPVYKFNNEGVNELELEEILVTLRGMGWIESFTSQKTSEKAFHIIISRDLHIKPGVAPYRKIILYYSKRPVFFLQSSLNECTYKIDGVKRGALVLALIENGPLSAKRLKPLAGYRTDSLLSNEIKAVNENFRSEMELLHDLILRTRSNGYFINPKFTIQKLT